MPAGGGEDGARLEKAEFVAEVAVSERGGVSDEASVTIHLRPPEEHFPGRAALLSAIGGMLLIGGLALCIAVALGRHGKHPPGFEEETRG